MHPVIAIKKLHDDAQLPVRSTEGAVGYDLFVYAKSETGRPLRAGVPPRNSRLFKCGFAMELPPNIWAGVYSRSGLALKQVVFVANAPGVIDPDYRGEVGVLLYNGGFETQYFGHGDRVAQLIFHNVQDVLVSEATELSTTERGSKGYGSTGQ